MDDGDDGNSDDSSLIDSILNIPSRIAQSLKAHFDSITSSVGNFKESVSSWFTDLVSNISTFRDNVGSWFTSLGTSIREGLDNVWTKITGTLGDGFETVKNNFTNTLQKLADVWLEINTLPLRIRNEIQELFEYFFVPDEELMNQRLDAVREKFAFINSISGYGEHLVNCLQSAAGTKAPVITINLRSYEGSYGWGSGGEVTLDFAWYARYKTLVDNLLAGIIWARWLWSVYKRIPEIIHGQGMVADHVIDISGRDL